MPSPTLLDFLSHLEELRRRLLAIALVLLIASVVGFFLAGPLLELIMKPLAAAAVKTLVFHKPHEAFSVHLNVAIAFGTAVTFPFLLQQVWSFVAPGLYEREKKSGLLLCLGLILLFCAGLVFAYVMAIPFGLRFLLAFQTPTLQPLLSVDAYFSFAGSTLLIFGLLFDFPVAIFGLVRGGFVRVETLAGIRRPIILVIFILAAVLTPSPDPVSQVTLALPLILLFELALWAARLNTSESSQWI